jgi:hypothetical protein
MDTRRGNGAGASPAPFPRQAAVTEGRPCSGADLRAAEIRYFSQIFSFQ